jgi:multidrug resistance efflux pump
MNNERLSPMNVRVWMLLLLLTGVAAAASVVFFRHGLADALAQSVTKEAASPSPAAGFVCFGHVDLRHGTAPLSPLRPGRVAEVLVEENDEVREGTPLVRLDSKLAGLQVEEAEAALRIARKQLEKAKRLPVQFAAKVKQQRAAVAAMSKRLDKARQLVAVKQKLQSNAVLTKEELALAELHAEEMEALLEVERAKLAELELNEPDMDVEVAQAECDRLQVKLEQAKNELEAYTLKAPAAGKIMQVHVQPGAVLGVQSPRPAIVFAAHGPLIVRAEIEQEYAEFVRVGQRVKVEDDTNAKAVCEGSITYIADWLAPRRVHIPDPTSFASGRTVECIISLDRGHPRLRIGQRVHVRMKRQDP